jgi:hypothetical protein
MIMPAAAERRSPQATTSVRLLEPHRGAGSHRSHRVPTHPAHMEVKLPPGSSLVKINNEERGKIECERMTFPANNAPRPINRHSRRHSPARHARHRRRRRRRIPQRIALGGSVGRRARRNGNRKLAAHRAFTLLPTSPAPTSSSGWQLMWRTDPIPRDEHIDPFILFIDDELRRHTVRALALGRSELRRNGHYSPKAFEQLIDSLAAQTSLDTPMIDGDDNLPEPELVDQREAARRVGCQ